MRFAVCGGKGALYYQFGRKDPFPGATTNTTSTSATSTAYSGTGASKITFANKTSSYVTVATAVKNPMIGYGGTTFSAGNTFPGTYPWSSEFNVTNSYLWLDATKSRTSSEKSVFDPSPAGWKIPIGSATATANFAGSTSASSASSSVVTLNGIAKYPLHGYRNFSYSNSGTMASVSSIGYLYTSYHTYTSGTYYRPHGYSLYIASGSITPNYATADNALTTPAAFSIRCVQE